MKYLDLHCDALTAEGVLHVTEETLRAGDCALQCFAAFVEGENLFRRTLALCDKFDAMCARAGYAAVRSPSDMAGGEEKNADMGPSRCRAMLCVENGGAIEGDLQKLDALFARGVRMLTLLWNDPNEFGLPAYPDYAGARAGRVPAARRQRGGGLTSFGFDAVERMAELGMIVDVSHACDRIVYDVAGRKRPFLASHSDAAAVYPCARNLTDGGIRAVAECGGAVGLCFYPAFLSSDPTPAGQREALLAHARRLLRVGGEDTPALGSDFDGAPENPFVKSPADLPRLLALFADEFGPRVAEKIAYGNAARVIRECLHEKARP